MGGTVHIAAGNGAEETGGSIIAESGSSDDKVGKFVEVVQNAAKIELAALRTGRKRIG